MKRKHKKKSKRTAHRRMRKADLPEPSNVSGQEYNSSHWGRKMWNVIK